MAYCRQRKVFAQSLRSATAFLFLVLAGRPASAQLVDLAIDLDLAQPGIQATAEVEFGRPAQGAVILTGFAQDLESYTVIISASPPGSLLCADTAAREWTCDAIHGFDASNPTTDLVGRLYDPPTPPCITPPPSDPLELFAFEICPLNFPLELNFVTALSLLSFSEQTLGDVPLSDARAQIHSATLTGVLPTPTPTSTATPPHTPTPPPSPIPTPTVTPTVRPTPRLGDLNLDGHVDSLDLFLFIREWQKQALPGAVKQ